MRNKAAIMGNIFKFTIVVLYMSSFLSGARAQSDVKDLVGTQGEPSTIDEIIRDRVAKGKRQIAQSFLKTELQNRAAVNVTSPFTWKLGTLHGSAASSFRSFNQSFILAGKDLFRLVPLPGADGFSTKKVATFQDFLGEIAFVESVEWNGLLLLLAGYKQGFMQLFTVSQNDEVVLQQSIDGFGEPVDAEYFMQNEQLFLIIVYQNNLSGAVPVLVYRWTGTHFDEETSRVVTNPVAVSTFAFQETVIIVVAVGAFGSQPAGLVVLRRNHDRLEILQFLPAGAPLAMQHFLFKSENYLFVTNVRGASVTYWWSGTELIIWDTLSGVEGARSIGVGYVRGETLLFVADQTRLRIYRPSDKALEMLDTLEFSATVKSASVYLYGDGVQVVVITESGGKLVPLVVELHLTILPTTFQRSMVAGDPLLQCMSLLETRLESRKRSISDLRTKSNQLLRTNAPGTFTGKLIVQKVEVKNAKVNSLGVNVNGVHLSASPHMLRDDLSTTLAAVKTLVSDMNNIVFRSKPAALSGRLLAEELVVETANIDSLHVDKLNGETFDPKNLLYYSSDQKLFGKISANVLEVDSLEVDSLSGNQIGDLLKRRGEHQEMAALESVPHLSAASLTLAPAATINGISLDRVVTTDMSPANRITGTKTFSGLDLQDLAVGNLNNYNFTQWVQGLVPLVQPPPEIQIQGRRSKNLFFDGDVVIRNLTVDTINDIEINALIASLFLKGLNQRITGDVKYLNKVVATELVSETLNLVPVSHFMTRTTNQVVTGPFQVDSFSAPDVVTNSVNGLRISLDVARIDAPFPVTGPVVFEKLKVGQLALPSHATIAGRKLSPRLLNEPLIIYEGKVTVIGTLKLQDIKVDTSKIQLKKSLISLNDLPMKYWTKSSNQVIYVPVLAPQGLTVGALNVDTLNGLRPERLLRVDAKRLRGKWNIPHAVILGNLAHSPTAFQFPVNPKILSESVVKTSGSYIVSGLKTFVGGVTVNNLDTVYLDQIKVSDVVSMDVVNNRSLQEVWVHGDLTVRSDMLVTYVNGMQLCDRVSKALLIDRPGVLNVAIFDTVTAADINVQTFNSISLGAVDGQGVPSAGPGIGGPGRGPLRRVRKVTIKGDVIVPALENVGRINEKRVNEYLSRVVDSRDQLPVIRGRKIFTGKLLVEGDFNALDFDGMDINYLQYNLLSRTRNQRIPVPVRIAELAADSFDAAIVNGIPLRNLLTSDQMSRQVIEGNVRFLNDVDVTGSLSQGSFYGNCDLNHVVSRLTILDGRKWTSMTVDGNLTWDKSLPDRNKGLGYYMGSAVTTDGDQFISGEVVFKGTVKTKNFYSRLDINDVAINDIARDALRKSAPEQIIMGQKILAKRLATTTMRVDGNVMARTIAGVDIPRFNASLVRVMDDREVHGHKRFLQGFKAEMLKADGSINGLTTSQVASYDLPMLPVVAFKAPLVVKQNLDFENVNGFSFEELLKDRVTLSDPQRIDGHITFERDVNVQGDLLTPSINRVDISDVVAGESSAEQVIEGSKQFMDSVRVEGSMDVAVLNGIHFTMAHSATIFKDEDVSIVGPVTFANKVTMNADLVTSAVNGEAIPELARKLASVSQRSLAQVRSIARIINDTNALLTTRGDLSEFLYLEPVLNLPASFQHTRRAIARSVGDEEVRVDVFGYEESIGETAVGGCGLPEGCSCPTQFTLEGLSPPILVNSNSSHRAFTFSLNDGSGFTIRVLTNTVSTSSSCRQRSDNLNEFTTITWMSPTLGSTLTEIVADVTIDPSPIVGYLSDAELLTVQGRIYVVLGISYDAESDTTNVKSVILRLDTNQRKARVVEKFDTQRVSSLDVFYTDKGAHLVVGNSYDSNKRSPQVQVDIYRFNAENEQLTLLRSVPADGVVDVVSVVQGGDSLVVFAQEQPYAPVLVLKYDPAHDDYHFNQQLSHDATPTGLGVFYVGQYGKSDAFLGVSTSDHMFHLYKFSHIEGFKPVLKYELRGVQGFTSFSVGQRQYLFFTSDESNSIVEVVKQVS